MSEHHNKFVKDNFLALIGNILVYGQSFFVMPFIVKIFGEDVFGSYILLTTFVGFMFGVSSLGVGYTYKRRLPSVPHINERSRLFFPQFIFQFCVVILFSMLFILFGRYFKAAFFTQGPDFSLLLVSVFFLLFFFYSQICDFFRFTARIKAYNLVIVGLPYITIFFALLLYFKGPASGGINLLLWAQILALLGVLIYGFFAIKSQLRFSYWGFNLKEILNDMRFGIPMMLAYCVDTVLSIGDRYVMAFFLTASAVGSYSAAYSLGSLIIFVAKGCGIVLPSYLSKLVDQGQEKSAELIINAIIKGFLLLGIPFVAGSIVMSAPLLKLLANQIVAERAWWITPLVASASIFYGMSIILINILFVKMLSAKIFYVNLFGAIINISLNVILMFVWPGIHVAALVTVISYVLSFVYLMKILKNHWVFHFDFKVIFKSLVAAMIMLGGLLLIQFYFDGLLVIWWGGGGVIIGAISLYIALLMLMNVFSLEEKMMIRRVFKLSL